ncbi:MAG: hypothetical protein QN229_07375 [Desulfurococcaceae archaeon TW002]
MIPTLTIRQLNTVKYRTISLVINEVDNTKITCKSKVLKLCMLRILNSLISSLSSLVFAR